jgi:hypothetical protein
MRPRSHENFTRDFCSFRCPGIHSDYVTDLITNTHRLLNGKELTAEQLYKI